MNKKTFTHKSKNIVGIEHCDSDLKKERMLRKSVAQRHYITSGKCRHDRHAVHSTASGSAGIHGHPSENPSAEAILMPRTSDVCELQCSMPMMFLLLRITVFFIHIKYPYMLHLVWRLWFFLSYPTQKYTHIINFIIFS